MTDISDLGRMFDGAENGNNASPELNNIRSLAYVANVDTDPAGQTVLYPPVFTVLQGTRRLCPNEDRNIGDSVQSSPLDILDCDPRVTGASWYQYGNARPIGILGALKDCPYLHIDMFGLDANLFSFNDLNEAYPQPVMWAPANREAAIKIMKGSKLPKFIVGISAFPGHTRYWKANGLEPQIPQLYFVLHGWDEFDGSGAVILPTTEFTCRNDFNGGDIVALVSVTDRSGQQRYHAVIECHPRQKDGIDVGAVHVDLGSMLPARAARDSTLLIG